MKDELSKLLKGHAAKKRGERDIEDADESRHVAFKAQAAAMIENVIAPTLSALGQELRSHGHEAGVSLADSTDSYPSVHLAFRLIDREDPQEQASPSRLSFSTTPTQDRFEVRTEIWGREGKEAGLGSAGRAENKLFADVNAEWVTKQALSFVTCVLEKA